MRNKGCLKKNIRLFERTGDQTVVYFPVIALNIPKKPTQKIKFHKLIKFHSTSIAETYDVVYMTGHFSSDM